MTIITENYKQLFTVSLFRKTRSCNNLSCFDTILTSYNKICFCGILNYIFNKYHCRLRVVIFTMSLLMFSNLFILACITFIICKNDPGVSSDKQILFSFNKGKEHRRYWRNLYIYSCYFYYSKKN